MNILESYTIRVYEGFKSVIRTLLKFLDSLSTCWEDKVSPTQIIRAAEDRLLWHQIVANVVRPFSLTTPDHTGWAKNSKPAYFCNNFVYCHTAVTWRR